MPDCTELGRELVAAWKECDRLRERERVLNEQLDRALSTVGDEIYDVGRTIDWILDGDE